MMTLPSLSQLLEVGDVQEYPYKKKSFAEAKNDPLFVLHTSGSTGKQSPSASIMTSTNRSQEFQSLSSTHPNGCRERCQCAIRQPQKVLWIPVEIS
jgi:hypothetical protein